MQASISNTFLVKAKENLKDWVSAIKEVPPEALSYTVGQNPLTPMEMQAPGDPTVISKGTMITGNVYTTGSFECHGVCNGDISASQTVLLSGKYTGNICGAQIVLSNAVVKGNILAEDRVIIDTSTQITGDIRACEINTAGKVNGSIHAAEGALVQKSAVILGNIYTTQISIEAGALLTGRLEITEASQKHGKFRID